MNLSVGDAQAFAESVAGVLARVAPSQSGWTPGGLSEPWPQLGAALGAIDWPDLAADPDLAQCAALGAVELGRQAAPLGPVDSLLGGSPVVGNLVRCPPSSGRGIVVLDGAPALREIVRAAPLPAADGLEVHRVSGLGPPVRFDAGLWPTAYQAWLNAGVGYLAGVGQAALDMTVAYVRERVAFGTTLAGLAPVQQLLAGAATAVRGVLLLATAGSGAEALAHAGPAIASACAACQQVTGAVGFTLEYPLHRFTQRARALAVWNDALLDALQLEPTPD
ncbi:MAG TPA: acyl-CoA dehydrogenase family protein [Solirubrobacteraceae bacterium]|nr:acyl-CoA dehydrogenase family protein [Solirubrobacteraceae bacterium]